jgi:NADH dehydrogenase (ubiquinone) 1 beta subcomplex subunit 9
MTWKPVVGQLSNSAHRNYVSRLYRRSLKLTQDWYWRREEFREKALIIRGYFEASKSLTNIAQVEEACGYTEHLLAVYRHPQPHICKPLLLSSLDINSPGGTKFERNLPLSEEVIVLV